MKILFNDDPNLESIEPRVHAKNAPQAILASTRFLLEICYVRDHFDDKGLGEATYQQLLARLVKLR